MAAARGVDPEEALALEHASTVRRARGAYFTPGPLVAKTLDAVAPWVPEGPLAIVDPACGAGAFLAESARRFPRARLYGLELEPLDARRCRSRLPGAEIREGDALRGGLEPLLSALPPGVFELWVGNPPYQGTSSLLRDPSTYARVRAWLPEDFPLPRGTSLRDDFAFFLLLAARRLSTRAGALAFITSATLLDAFLYAPLRGWLLEHLRLREVVELGAGAFTGTRVRTCITVWTTRTGRRAGREGVAHSTTEWDDARPSKPFTPEAPEFLFRPVPPEAAELDRAWRAEGIALPELIPFSAPGLKTRFDELLVDEDSDRLLARIADFLRTPPGRLEAFATRHAIPERAWPKLEALRRAVPPGMEAEPAKLRPFFRWAGARHRYAIPPEARAFCYLDRRMIPRGDHRLRGDFDPHLGEVKLLFNARELPLCAALLEEEGCVHDHRHARFAPLLVPERVRDNPRVLRFAEPLGRWVPNLSPEGVILADRLGGPRALFRMLARFINGAPVQNVWAKSFGPFRDLPVPFDLERWT